MRKENETLAEDVIASERQVGECVRGGGKEGRRGEVKLVVRVAD